MSLHEQLDAACLTMLESEHEGQRVRLLAPRAGFWQTFKYAPEFYDGEPDPLDRYSKRVINPIADQYGLQAAFPSDGPPYPAFITWALKNPDIHLSPIGLLVHDRFGLWISFRGALIGGEPKDLTKAVSPCEECAEPCKSACPASAFKDSEYDVPSCQAHLHSGEVDCWNGCLARRSCPAAKMDRDPAQSRFHMKAFAS